MQKTSTRTIVEAGLMVAVFSVICLISNYVPFLSMLVLIFPIPFIIMYVRHNAAVMIMTLAVSSVVGSMVTQNFIWIILLFISGPMAFSIGFLMKRKSSTTMIMLVTSMVAALGTTLFFQVALKFFPVPGSPSTVMGLFQTIFDQSGEMIKAMNLPNTDKMLASQAAAMELMRIAMPALFVMSGFIFTLVNVLVTYKIFDRLRIPYQKPQPFSEFFIPNEMMLGITVVFSLVLGVGLLKILDVQMVFVNIISLFIYLFTIQGVATAYGWLLQKGYKKGMAVGLLVMIFVFNLTYGLALLGWLDLLFDFRKIRKRKTEE